RHERHHHAALPRRRHVLPAHRAAGMGPGARQPEPAVPHRGARSPCGLRLPAPGGPLAHRLPDRVCDPHLAGRGVADDPAADRLTVYTFTARLQQVVDIDPPSDGLEQERVAELLAGWLAPAGCSATWVEESDG